MFFDDAIKQKKPVRVDDAPIANELMLNPIQLNDESEDSSDAEDSAKVPLAVLLKTPIKTIVEKYLDHQTPAKLDETDSLERFMDMIRQRKLRSCVVMYNSHSCCGFRKKMAFIDVRDVSYHLMAMVREWRARSFPEVLAMCRRTPVGKVANISGRSPFTPVSEDEPLSALCAAFANASRVPLFSKREFKRILSPVDLLNVLRQARAFGEVQRLSKLNKALTPAMKPVQCLMATDSLLKGANMLEKLAISALPIVEVKGSRLEVKDVLTVTDVQRVFQLAALQGEQKDLFNEPAISFVAQLRQHLPHHRPAFLFLEQNAQHHHHHQQQQPAACASSHQHGVNMRDILDQFASTPVSRLFLLDDLGKPGQMVTLTDVVRLLAGQLGDPSAVYKPAKPAIERKVSAHSSASRLVVSEASDQFYGQRYGGHSRGASITVDHQEHVQLNGAMAEDGNLGGFDPVEQ